MQLSLDRVIDIGAAEGYYAVGFACRRPDTSIIAFEMEPDGQKACAEMARRNGLGHRVTVLGECNPPALARTIAEGISLIVCDCEGAEDAILVPAKVPALSNA